MHKSSIRKEYIFDLKKKRGLWALLPGFRGLSACSPIHSMFWIPTIPTNNLSDAYGLCLLRRSNCKLDQVFWHLRIIAHLFLNLTVLLWNSNEGLTWGCFVSHKTLSKCKEKVKCWKIQISSCHTSTV